MSNLDLKKTQVELARVQAAKLEMEYIIDQRMEEIQRLQDNIKIQENKERELSEKIKSLKG